jgi:hypothetical protein
MKDGLVLLIPRILPASTRFPITIGMLGDERVHPRFGCSSVLASQDICRNTDGKPKLPGAGGVAGGAIKFLEVGGFGDLGHKGLLKQWL